LVEQAAAAAVRGWLAVAAVAAAAAGAEGPRTSKWKLELASEEEGKKKEEKNAEERRKEGFEQAS
jgi:hypothetical protein